MKQETAATLGEDWRRQRPPAFYRGSGRQTRPGQSRALPGAPSPALSGRRWRPPPAAVGEGRGGERRGGEGRGGPAGADEGACGLRRAWWGWRPDSGRCGNPARTPGPRGVPGSWNRRETSPGPRGAGGGAGVRLILQVPNGTSFAQGHVNQSAGQRSPHPEVMTS